MTGLAGMTANLEEAGTWYYVVDCAICKAVVPFKHAPEDEPIVRFPTMRVRCFHCHTDHTYASDLISHRKTAAPPSLNRPHQPVMSWVGVNQDHQISEIFKRDRPPSHAGDGDREASRDRQEDRAVGDSGARVILNREIDPISFSLRCYNMLIVAVSGKRATIFFLSSCFFATGWVSQLALDIFYPPRLAVLNELRLSDPAMLLEIGFFGTVLFGLVLFIFGIGSFFVEAFGFKRRLTKSGFARIDFRIANLAVHAASTVALFLIETWQRKFPTRDRVH
jgi:hypothetical protein